MRKGYRVYALPNFRDVELEEFVSKAEILFYGEVHRVPWIIKLASELILMRYEAGLLRFVGLEYFNYRMEGLVREWLEDRIDWGDFLSEYSKGPEGFPLRDYRPILDEIKRLGIEIVGVMPPRDEVRKVSRNGLEGINEISDSPVQPSEVRLDYKGYRERLLSMIPSSGPMAMLDPEKIVMAQAYKDEVIAYKVADAYRRLGPGIVITGYAHSEIYGSASTRLRNRGIRDYIVLTTRNTTLNDDLMRNFKMNEVMEARYIALKI